MPTQEFINFRLFGSVSRFLAYVNVYENVYIIARARFKTL